jgi:hypothetical protein
VSYSEVYVKRNNYSVNIFYIQAGLHKNRLVLALEPEGASVLCKRLPIERLRLSKSNDIEAFKSGSNYMVLDLGGKLVILFHF